MDGWDDEAIGKIRHQSAFVVLLRVQQGKPPCGLRPMRRVPFLRPLQVRWVSYLRGSRRKLIPLRLSSMRRKGKNGRSPSVAGAGTLPAPIFDALPREFLASQIGFSRAVDASKSPR